MTSEDAGTETLGFGEAVEPEPLSGLTGFKRNLLFALSKLEGTNPCGQDVKKALAELYDEEVKHGRLYQNLSDLVDTGLVEKMPLDGRTNMYRLTDDAYTRLAAHHAWQAECLPGVRESE